MKRVPRNRLLLCFRFRPLGDMETVLETKTLVHCSSTTSLAAYFELEDDGVRTSRSAPSCPDCRCSGRHTSRPPKRIFSRVVRAVMFGTILVKRVRERKGYHHQKPDQRTRSSSLDSKGFRAKEDDEKSVNGGLVGLREEKKGNQHQQLVSLYSLSSGSSSSFPFSISESVICSANKKSGGSGSSGVKRIDAERRSCYAFNSGIGLLVISLAVTVVQGRVFGILMTSIWVYFFAWMHMEDRWLKKKTKFPATTEIWSAQAGRKKVENPEKALNI